jgi:mannose-6-phosphate isomerase-like protein (cupin superfamily)
MATLRRPADAVELGLPGRRSREILSGATGAHSTIRLVEIAPPKAGEAPRPPHWHPDCEECIHVLSGEGTTWVDGTDIPVRPGDTLHVAPSERHVTRNTGSEPLVLLCFFPVPAITVITEEAPPHVR